MLKYKVCAYCGLVGESTNYPPHHNNSRCAKFGGVCETHIRDNDVVCIMGKQYIIKQKDIKHPEFDNTWYELARIEFDEYCDVRNMLCSTMTSSDIIGDYLSGWFSVYNEGLKYWLTVIS